jgi:hypothetical protein
MDYQNKVKRFSLLVLFIVVGVCLADGVGHLICRLWKGVFLWEVTEETGLFNIRPFTEFVADDRMVTNKKNYRYTCVAGNQSYKPWTLITDANGFRVGLNQYHENLENIVFLGASTLFGWGVEGDKTIPSKFYQLLSPDQQKRFGVINASVPAYSLYQTVKRYEYEIHDRFQVKMVIFQIYNPVTPFLFWGKNWNKKICWTSRNTTSRLEDLIRYHQNQQGLSGVRRWVNRYSSIHYVWGELVNKIKFSQLTKTDIYDEETMMHFDKENGDTLEELVSLLKPKNIPLILVSSNPAVSIEEGLRHPWTKVFFSVVQRYNRFLKSFAHSHENVFYLDTAAHFDRLGREGCFVDACCHLSEYGAQREAQYIYDAVHWEEIEGGAEKETYVKTTE